MKKLLIIITLIQVLYFHTIHTQNFYRNNNDTFCTQEHLYDNNLNLYAPVKFSALGIEIFLKNQLSHPLYATDVLAHTFKHVTQFLEYAKTTRQPRLFITSVLRIFINGGIKRTQFISAYAFQELTETMPDLLSHYFVSFQLPATEEIKNKLADLLYDTFLQNFCLFKQDPDSFFNTLSDQIIKTIEKQQTPLKDTHINDVKKMITIFLELSINKLLWSPEEHIKTWTSVKKIAHNLKLLFDAQIIADIEDLNDLFVTLVERYCFFLDIAQDALPRSFYEAIKEEIAKERPFFLTLEESERFIETKFQRLLRTLMHGEARARIMEN